MPHAHMRSNLSIEDFIMTIKYWYVPYIVLKDGTIIYKK